MAIGLVNLINTQMSHTTQPKLHWRRQVASTVTLTTRQRSTVPLLSTREDDAKWTTT